MTVKTVVELDLVGYSDISRALEENLDTEIVARFNDQIQRFVDAGLAATEAKREQVVMATTGDGAILAFTDSADAHRFALAVHRAAETHNTSRSAASAKRWFRIGAATGDLYQRPRNGKQEIAGMVIVRAVRLESAAQPGELVVDAATFNSLPLEYQAAYGQEESVLGKREETFAARRYKVVAYKAKEDTTPKAEEDTTPSVISILQLFDSLHPRDQMDRLMLLLQMPQQFRPPDTLELHRRQDKILDWAASGGAEGLVKLATNLKHLIGVQSPRK
jgi:class 3 adenylate cyclase